MDFTKEFLEKTWISLVKMRTLVIKLVSFHARNGDALAMQILALLGRCLATMKEAPWRQVSEE